MEEHKPLGHNAGYNIIQAETYVQDQQGCEYQIVLGFNPESGLYAVWDYKDQPGGDRHYIYTYYTRDRTGALAYYHERLRGQYEAELETKGGVLQY